MFDTIVFDLDGTLTDPKEGITKSAQYALQFFGIDEPDLRKLEVIIGPNLYNSFETIYGLSTEEATIAVAHFRRRYKEIGWKENKIYPGMADMLKKLKLAGKHLAVASLKPDVFISDILDMFEVSRYFDVTVGTSIESQRDTKGQIMKIALDRLKVSLPNATTRQENCGIAMVGDRKDDIEGARSCNVYSVGVRYGYALPHELEKAGAMTIVDSVSSLCEFLLS